MDPNNLSWVYGLVGLVQSVASTGSMVTQQVRPYPTPAVISTPTPMPGQSCKLATHNDFLDGSFAIVQHPADATHPNSWTTLECVPADEGSRR